MTTISFTDTTVQTPLDDAEFDEAQLAAASFLGAVDRRDDSPPGDTLLTTAAER